MGPTAGSAPCTATSRQAWVLLSPCSQGLDTGQDRQGQGQPSGVQSSRRKGVREEGTWKGASGAEEGPHWCPLPQRRTGAIHTLWWQW